MGRAAPPRCRGDEMQSDPESRGSYSNIPVGRTSVGYVRSAEPVADPVPFAGEATDRVGHTRPSAARS
jgi:hypothetical protein